MAKRCFTDTTLAIDTYARLYQRDHAGVSYQDAVKAVLSEHGELASEYKAKPEEPEPDKITMTEAKTYSQAQASLDGQAQELVDRLGIPFPLAFKRILCKPENAQLARVYLSPTKKELRG